MIATILAGLMAAAPVAATDDPGAWLMIAVARVIAPDQIPGQCFVQARVDQVLSGAGYRAGDTVAITVPCLNGGLAPSDEAGPRAPQTIESLRSQKRALVHLDAGGRVLANDYYGLGEASAVRPGSS